MSTEQQKAEFIKLLDLHQKNGMNAVLVQIRPAADAFFPSKYEPWSVYLTGKQGEPPSPYYDPLQFMIEETHARGMEFHAWMNPYRADNNVKEPTISPTHITRLFPQWFFTYDGKKLFDPGLPQVREHINRVVKDLVERYDIDAVHFDDYFYPYPAGREIPDELTYIKYGNGMNKKDWRRSNVDTIIKQLSQTIKAANSRVKFGISPFGVWRNSSKDPRGSASKAGLTNYDDLYADILLWLKEGWIDYVVPQLYWETSHSYVGYYMLTDWWSRNTFGRQLFIGHGVYRTYEAKSYAWKKPDELSKQIRANRANENVMGSVYFSSKTFNNNPNGWNDTLRNNYYKYPALVPPVPWIDSIPPLPPLIDKLKRHQYRVFYRGAEPIKGFAIYKINEDAEENREDATLIKVVVADKTTDVNLSDLEVSGDEKVFISCVDRNNNVSEWVRLK